MWIGLYLLGSSAWAADTGLAIEVDGSATPSGYSEALALALRLEAEERGLSAVTFHGSARGAPMLGVTASATASVTCGGATHELAVSDVRVNLGSNTNNWQGIGKTVAERLLRELDCTAAAAEPAPAPPAAEVKPVERDDRVKGSASPESFTLALRGAFSRALEGRPEIAGVTFYGSAKGTPVVGLSANAGVDVTCGGETHELRVEDVATPLGDGTSWNRFADMVVERLLRDLTCE
jgi:hypothetical protein